MFELVFSFVEKIQTKYRKHVFDLEKPHAVKEFCGYKFSAYKCIACGKVYNLDLEEMKRLPPSMARGCPGRCSNV